MVIFLRELEQYMDNSYASDYRHAKIILEHMGDREISKTTNDSSITHSTETTTFLLTNDIEN
ncbi:hypothetical protein PFDG_05341, partial [Plasmodium falciparum Dd2]